MASEVFVRPKPGAPATRHLYVANLGPAVGVSLSEARTIFCAFGVITDVQEAGESGNRLYVSYADCSSAQNACAALHQRPCAAAAGRPLTIQYAELKTLGAPTGRPQPRVYLSDEELRIPGLFYVPDFVSEGEASVLLSSIDVGKWHRLAKRRVQHYGYEFRYQSRNVDPAQSMGRFPPPLQTVSRRIEQVLRELCSKECQVASQVDEIKVSSAHTPTDPDVFCPLDQLTVNEYPAGVGLSPHVDTHSAFQGAIVSLSLAGPAVMEFRRQTKESASEPSVSNTPDASLDRRCLFLAPRSLLILTGEARFAWQHYIPHRKGDLVGGRLISRTKRRVSLTFRKVRTGPCGCGYPECCDSQQGVREGGPRKVESEGWMRMEGALDSRGAGDEAAKPVLPTACHQSSSTAVDGSEPGQEQGIWESAHRPEYESTESGRPDNGSRSSGEASNVENVGTSGASAFVIPDIEKRHVHQVYDAIAMHFSATRFAKWPKVALFLEGLPEGAVVVDAGCGNGKYLGFNPSCFFIGCDISAPLVGMASQRGFDVAVADALRLPYRSASCDAAISIAVLHHLSSDARRRQAIRELLRVVKSGDRVLITVWAREQEDPKLLGKWTPLIGTEAWPEDLVAPGGKQPGDGGDVGRRRPVGESAGERAGALGGVSREVLERGGSGAPASIEFGEESEKVRDENGEELSEVGRGRVGSGGSGPVGSQEGVGSGLRDIQPSGMLESIPENRDGAGAGVPGPVAATTDAGSSTQEKDLGSPSAGGTSGLGEEPRADPDSGVQTTESGAAALAPSGGNPVRAHNVQEYFVPWHLPYHRVEVGAADRDGDRGLARRDPLKQALVYERYYHVFVEGELERLVAEVGGCTIVDHFFDKSNWCVIAAKD